MDGGLASLSPPYNSLSLATCFALTRKSNLHNRRDKITRRANHFVLSEACQALHAKIYRFRFSEIRDYVAPSCPRSRGAFRDRHERWERDAVDVKVARTSATGTDGQAVWS